MVARIDARWAQSRSERVASQISPRTSPTVSDSGIPTLPKVAPLAPDPLGPRPTESKRLTVAIMPPAMPRVTSTVPAPKRPWTVIGLRGYSPIALVTARAWVPGNQRFAWGYKGIIYYMASPAELQRFKENPERYAPQVLGCDPVILDITDRAVPGDIRYAAFFDGELYLFVSEKSRQAFRQDPERYVRTKHVLKVDELDDMRLE
jgi:YHS domain-containing protein